MSQRVSPTPCLNQLLYLGEKAGSHSHFSLEQEPLVSPADCKKDYILCLMKKMTVVLPWPEACRKEQLASQEAGSPPSSSQQDPANLLVTLGARKQNKNK